MVAVAVALDLAALAGVLAYAGSPAHQRHDPVHALQQLDAFYLDEPAPLADELGLREGVVTLVVVCERCAPPPVETRGVAVVVSSDPRVAASYALATPRGRVGPGYAIVDAARRLRYRTFDPGLARHRQEVDILLKAAR